MRQKTIRKEGSISGVGLHSGERATVYFKPAPVGFGIQFFKNGRPVKGITESIRCTAVGARSQQILTVEHVLAALHGLKITNIRMEVDGGEIPGLDGSALGFVRLFKKLGLKTQAAPSEVYEVKEPLFCSGPEKAISIFPASEFSIAYVLDYRVPYLEDQTVDFRITPEVFEREIAPARTFCTLEEARLLKKQGYGKGATAKNALVISKKGVVNNRLRFVDECARHKVLDILGDLALLGFFVRGRIVAIRSGHALNRELVDKIKKERGL